MLDSLYSAVFGANGNHAVCREILCHEDKFCICRVAALEDWAHYMLELGIGECLLEMSFRKRKIQGLREKILFFWQGENQYVVQTVALLGAKAWQFCWVCVCVSVCQL